MRRVSFITVLISGITLGGWGQEKAKVAILDLQAVGVSATEALTISNRVRNEMFLTGQYTVLEREKMQEIAAEVGFQLSGCTSSECVIEAGRIFGMQKMIAGSVDKIGAMYTINLRLIEVETGEIVKVAAVDYEGRIEDAAKLGAKEAVGKLVAAQNADVKITEATQETRKIEPATSISNKKFSAKQQKKWGVKAGINQTWFGGKGDLVGGEGNSKTGFSLSVSYYYMLTPKSDLLFEFM